MLYRYSFSSSCFTFSNSFMRPLSAVRYFNRSDLSFEMMMSATAMRGEAFVIGGDDVPRGPFSAGVAEDVFEGSVIIVRDSKYLRVATHKSGPLRSRRETSAPLCVYIFFVLFSRYAEFPGLNSSRLISY